MNRAYDGIRHAKEIVSNFFAKRCINQDSDKASLLCETINYNKLKDFSFPKIMENFYLVVSFIETVPDENQIGMNFDRLISFFNSLDDKTLSTMQGEIIHLVEAVLRLSGNKLNSIQPNEIVNLLKKSGLDVKQFLRHYSQSPSTTPQFFIRLCYNLPQKEEFLLAVFNEPKVSNSMKMGIMREFASQINWNWAIQNIISTKKIAQSLFESLETTLVIEERRFLYETLFLINTPTLTKRH